MYYTSTFRKAFDLTVMKWEGGSATTNDHTDRGGLTKYGISKRAHPTVDVAKLTKAKAMKLYYYEYWIKGKCFRMPRCVAVAHFDACVNVGVKQAAKLLQRAVRVKADGVIGPITLSAIKKRGCSTLRDVGARRIVFYIGLIIKRPSQIKYAYGWSRRTFDIILTAEKLA